MIKPKISFLFGAGAELDYGMPTGGEFALDIFLNDPTLEKEEFRKKRNTLQVENQMQEWLPKNFRKKPITTFGTTEYNEIIKNTIMYRKEDIEYTLSMIDDWCEKNIKFEEYKKAFEKIARKSYSEIQTDEKITIFDQRDSILKTKFVESLIIIYEHIDSEEYQLTLKQIIFNIIKIEIFVLGSQKVDNMNSEIFGNIAERPLLNDLRDSFSNLFLLDNTEINASEIRMLLKSSKSSEKDIDKIIDFAKTLTKKIYADILDYKAIIDKNWHCLYYPNSQWAKFCKMSVFLWSVRNYIAEKAEKIDLDKQKNSYYRELNEFLLKDNSDQEYEIEMIATTNYTSLIKKEISTYPNRIYYLNGHINYEYDPFLNRKIEKKESTNYLTVPLIFTQSATKPMTNIEIARKYVEFADKLESSDIICVIGYGFNSDDEHINNILRYAIEEKRKKIVVFDTNSENNIIKKLRINKNYSNIEYKKINPETRSVDGKPWLEVLNEF